MQQLQKFKKTEFGEIPKDWNIKKFGEFSETYRYPTFYGIQYHADGIPVLNIGNINNNSWRLSTDPNNYQKIDEETSERFGRTIVNEGDLVLAVRGATIGKFALVPKVLSQSNINANLLKISLNKLICIPSFFWYYSQTNRAKYDFKGFVASTAKETVQASKLRLWKIPLPSIKEQQKIASILSRVDELIQKTDQIIEQTQRLKKGLMQTLLTNGIGHTKFKKAEDEFHRTISIPESWKVVKLEEVCEILDGKRIPIEESERNKRHGVYPYYGASGIIDYIDDYIFDDRLICLAEDGENLRSRVLPVAFTIEGKTWVNNHAHVLKPRKEYLDHFYFDYFLNHIRYEKYLSFTAQPKLNQDNMKLISVTLPAVEEQRKIASILSNVDKKKNLVKDCKMNMEGLKKGLMQKLLTGKIRVGSR